ncbi:SGNH/GDSL hydrolase family protein [Kineobactrum salinum]|uniref:SGNH hydrolase-type esterase domain-containing protein n=1 Tax=Kineobactrum salinum TaxID=2708301 RepID=A0A6C0U2A7_9GAMM|nr:hypothetical protein [Kineobactrum salinum]QIB66166.1 hypothetical protein G3T16_12830 [Kineobactrum salinum]
MYSWTTIRVFCLVLLLLPIAHLAWLTSREALIAMDHSPSAWEHEVAAYARADRERRLPTDPVVVVGGRAVKLWQGLEQLLAPRPVLLRGLGAATVDDINHYYEQLIGFYQPKSVVLLPGTSNFHVRDNKDPAELLQAVQELEAQDAAHGVTRNFYVFAPLKLPFYPGDHERMAQSAVLLQSWAATRPRVTVLDPNPLLADRTGAPAAQFFRPGGRHLNEHGYLRLGMLLREHIHRPPGQATEGETLASGIR